MLRDLDDHSRRLIFRGLRDDNEERGIISCRLQRTFKYDHTRHDEAWERQRQADRDHHRRADGRIINIPQGPPVGLESNGGPKQWTTWNFVFVLTDGTEVHMHPSWEHSEVFCSTGMHDSHGGAARSNIQRRSVNLRFSSRLADEHGAVTAVRESDPPLKVHELTANYTSVPFNVPAP